MQFAGGTKDGTVLLATLVRAWYDQALSADPSSHDAGSLAWAELLSTLAQRERWFEATERERERWFVTQTGV